SRGNQPPPSDALRFLINHQGVIESEPAIYTLTGPPDHPGIKESYRRPLGKLFQRAAWNRVGLGSVMKGDDITVVLTLWEQLVELQSIPRRLTSEGRAPLVIRMLTPFTNPQIVVTFPGGQVGALPITLEGKQIKTELRCQAGDGRYQVEIVASSDSGPAVLGNFPIFCGVTPPNDISAYDEDEAENIDPAEAEQELTALINQARLAAGLKPLLWDNRLAAIARAHSRDMVTNNFIAHVSPTTGDVSARVKRAGLNLGLILENVGQEGGVEKAHRGFMASPAHRANILNKKATRIGIGIVIKAGGGAPLYVTELFAAD
ncbi:MAG TPA: CAP domain-containing protein, partial [Polyangia bacterium]